MNKHAIYCGNGLALWLAILLLVLCQSIAGPSIALAETFKIEIDYMLKEGVGGHSHKPTTSEIAAVVKMFACQGHELIIDLDDAIPHYDVIPRNPNNCDQSLFDYSGSPDSFGELKKDFKDHGDSWHYCIFAHKYEDSECNTTNSSGLGQVNGMDFIVTLGNFLNDEGEPIGTPWDRASTLAHEFGHNLGLGHCGNMDCDAVGDRPLNVPSIMSYFYQLQGVRTNLLCQGLTFEEAALFKELDYSHGTMCTLDEDALDEDFGTGMIIGVDWNCSGAVSGTVDQNLDKNNWNFCGGDTCCLQTLSDYDEWAKIENIARRRQGEVFEVKEISCITSDEWTRMKAQAVCPQPPVDIEPCIDADMYYLQPTIIDVPTGTCRKPFGSVGEANDAASDGSVFFLAPGIYAEDGTVIIQKQLTIFSRGSAVIQP